MNDQSDGELLERWRAGDSPAFTELVRRHQAVCLSHARALLGPGTEPEDCVQDVFCRLAAKPPELANEVRGDAEAERALLVGWLHRVTRNRAMDMMRTNERRRRREAVAAPPEATSGGIEAVEGRDTQAAVERGLERLPEDQREVLVLRLVGERSYREIAEITGRKVGTVGWLISQGMKALSRDLSELLPAVPGDGSTHADAAGGPAR
ncbi:MAG: sigma-70 family RNA polymerase sigma factor [Planctomycetota bacterium]